MTDTPSWSINGTYLRGFARAAQQHGYFDELKRTLSPDDLAPLERPGDAKWWPGTRFTPVLQTLGPARTRQCAITASRDSMAGLVRPLASVLFVVSGASLLTLLSKIDTFIGVGVQHVTTSTRPDADGKGATVTFTFPEPVVPEVAEIWHGVFDVGFSLAGHGTVAGATHTSSAHSFHITW